MAKRIATLVLLVGLCWPAAVRAEVVLEASEIDSSTVEAGALAVVVHMQDKPHLVVQMAEPLPTSYQTIVVDGDTLTVQVLAEPLPTDEPLSAAINDSLSAQKEAMESKGIKKKSKSRRASERLARFGFGVMLYQ